MPTIHPFLWFDDRAEEAANFYVSVFPNSRISEVSRYPEGSPGPVGGVMAVAFELDGMPFLALNGGPLFKFTEAISFQIMCETQDEVDHYWNELGNGGEPSQCGWLKDRFGLSWQVTPTLLGRLLRGDDPQKSARAMQAMLGMRKLDCAELQRAYDGG